MAKITKATKGGRTIYKIAGTSKYALTLAKAKEIAAKVSGAKRTTAKKRTSTAFTRSYESGTTGRRIARTARKARTPQAVVAMFKDMKALEEFYFDLKDMGAEALHEIGVAGDAAFARRVRTAAKARLDEHDRDSAHAAKIFRHLQPKAGRKPAVKKAKKTASRRKTKKTRAPKLIGRAYTNRYGERVGPTRILGRTVDYAMKTVRMKGRNLLASEGYRKRVVADFRKALQKAGFLRGASTRSNPSRSAKKAAGGITLAETRAIGRLIAAEVVGAEFGSALNRKLVAASVTKPGVITGDLAEALHDEGVIENYVIPSSLHGRGYLDFDGPKRVVWVPAPYFSGVVSGEH